MRRSGIAGVVLVAGLALPPASAQATFHLEKVNELMLASAGGDSSVQFVELLDNGGTEEQFTPVFARYRLVIYDGAGKQLGEQTLNPTGLRNAAASGTEYLLSTAAADSALGVSADERLTVTLPVGSGQVCYQGNPGAMSCITYGTITQAVPTNSSGTGSARGPAPPGGQSAQRQPDDSIQTAAPTPKAPNRAGSSTPPGGGGPSGATPHRFAGVGFSSHTAHVDRRGHALIALECPVGISGRCFGQITLSSGTHHVRVGGGPFTLAAGQRGVIKLALSGSELQALARHGIATVAAGVDARDGAGMHRHTSAKLTLRR